MQGLFRVDDEVRTPAVPKAKKSRGVLEDTDELDDVGVEIGGAEFEDTGEYEEIEVEVPQNDDYEYEEEEEDAEAEYEEEEYEEDGEYEEEDGEYDEDAEYEEDDEEAEEADAPARAPKIVWKLPAMSLLKRSGGREIDRAAVQRSRSPPRTGARRARRADPIGRHGGRSHRHSLRARARPRA